MRLVIAADSPEHLWLPLITVQAVLRDNSRTRACLLSVTKPASMSACRSSRSLADCLAFMLELIDAGLCVGPFCGPARMLVLYIVSLRRRKLATVKCDRATCGSVTPNTKFTFFCRI